MRVPERPKIRHITHVDNLKHPQRMVRDERAPRMTVGRASLLGLMRRYLVAAMDPVVTLLEIHKLMYFMQESGEDLRLRYQKGPFGPYAENLRHVLSLMEGHWITGYGADVPDKQITSPPEAWDKAEQFLRSHPATGERFGRVAALIEGFETPFGMELLATVHWVANREGASTLGAVVEKTYAWSDRKRQFSAGQLQTAWDELDRQGWLLSR